jgi:hypothetical protein
MNGVVLSASGQSLMRLITRVGLDGLDGIAPDDIQRLRRGGYVSGVGLSPDGQRIYDNLKRAQDKIDRQKRRENERARVQFQSTQYGVKS